MPTPRDPRSLLRRARSRYRRPVAAVLAALATIVAISALRPASPAPTPEAAPTVDFVRPGDVTVPVPLSVGGDAVTTGDVVDVVAVDDSGAARIIASRVLVTEPAAGSGYSSDTVVLMAMSERDALTVTAAADEAPLAVLIHPQATRSG